MSSRPFRARGLVAVVLIAAAGCQDYNFNPVGHCVLQPGSQRFTLSNVSTADVLFVVDDSGSMAGEQARLAEAFTDFVENLTSTNRGRAQGGLLPLDFHVAVTTSSIFQNYAPSQAQTCRNDCGVETGKLVCCAGSQPVYGPRDCQTTADCPMSGTVCSKTCTGFKGEGHCCLPGDPGTFPADAVDSTFGQVVRCSVPDLPCGELKTHYEFTDSQCTPSTRGVALEGFPYPDGGFVGSTSVSAAAANPRVLHFDKRLYYSGKNAQGFTIDQLKRFFEQNVRVGTCGSPQEQGLEASRRALQRALLPASHPDRQLDTYAYDWTTGLTSGVSSTPPPAFTAPGGIPTPGANAVWPSPTAASKLVVVYVGDEDDCGSPKDPSAGVVLLRGEEAGHDACSRDASEPAPLGKKEYAVQAIVSYLTGLGRPVGAAFVVSATSSGNDVDCRNETCNAGICCDRPCVASLQLSGQYSSLCGDPGNPATCVCAKDVCGGQAPGTRFVDAAKELKRAGADVVVGSVCGDFKPMLREVAEIVKPPQTLSLPTVPAESAIAILRIATSSGQTRKICGRPLAPRQPNYTRQEAEATGADWWFVGTATADPPYDPTGTSSVAAPSKFVYINPKGSCIANPGETYSADYLGVVPEGGCRVTAGTDPLGALDCQAKLGGRVTDWECYVPPGLASGTCTCRSGS